MPSGRDFFSPKSEHPFTGKATPAHRAAQGFFILAVTALCVFDILPQAPGLARGEERLRAIYDRYGDRMPIIDNKGSLALYQAGGDESSLACADVVGPGTMVALVFGQSNASNTVDPGYASTRPVYAWQAGRCTKVRDPLPGTSSDQGSSWSRLGDRVIDSGLYDKVLFIDIARGGSSILNWGPGGDLNVLLLATLDALAAQGIAPTHVFFHHGEADCALGLPGKDYKVVLASILNQIRSRAGEGCDIFISRASLFYAPDCGSIRNPQCFRSCEGIVAAQTETADPARRIFSGPNTDLLVPWFDRNDGYHFTAQAADRFAAAWMPLLAHGPSSPVPASYR